jgi:hypothetical protein
VAAYRTVIIPARLTFENKNLFECKGDKLSIPFPKWTNPWAILTTNN